MKNENTPESSENSSSPRSFKNKSLLQLVLVHSLKRKIQMRQKPLKTLTLIKVINGKADKNSVPHKNLGKKYTIHHKNLRSLILCSYVS